MPVHSIAPVYNARSRILILGSFPSVQSRKDAFFYAHPQNRFWKVLAAVLHTPVPGSVEEKKAFLLSHHIALWDVIHSCTITGSSDASIQNVVVNDIEEILQAAEIKAIFTNGNKADALYRRYLEKQTGMKAIRLPSTSPANASYSLDRLISCWSVIRSKLQSGTDAS